MHRWPSNTRSARCGTWRVSCRSAQTLWCSSPRACAAAAWAHEATTSDVVSPDCSASWRASAALAVPIAGSMAPSAAAPLYASASHRRPSTEVGRTPSKARMRPLGIAELDLRQRGLGPQVVAVGFAGGVGRGPVGRQRRRVAHRVERLGAQPQCLGMVRLEPQQRLEVPQGVAEGGQSHRLARRSQQPGHGLARLAGGQPVSGHDGRRHVQLGQPRGDLPVHLQAAMRRHLLDQGLPHQLMPEAVAGARGASARARRATRPGPRPPAPAPPRQALRSWPCRVRRCSAPAT